MIPELGRSPGEGKGYPLQYSGLENSMDCTVHGVAELDTTEHFHNDYAEIKLFFLDFFFFNLRCVIHQGIYELGR